MAFSTILCISGVISIISGLGDLAMQSGSILSDIVLMSAFTNILSGALLIWASVIMRNTLNRISDLENRMYYMQSAGYRSEANDIIGQQAAEIERLRLDLQSHKRRVLYDDDGNIVE